MAGIYSTIGLTDRMTQPLRQINSMVNTLISDIEKCGKTADVSFQGGSLTDMERKIREVNDSQNDLTDSMRRGESASSNLNSKLKTLATTYLSLRAAVGATKLLVGMSDEYAQTTARLNMMNDGLQTTADLQKKILDAARDSRASYFAMADIVGKLGNQVKGVFSTNDELIAFSETLNKMFVVSGLDTTGIESTMYNLTQSLSSGALMGQDYRILKQNAPQMISILQDFYGVSRAELDKMVSSGQVGANDIKNAMLGASQSINSQFEKMPITWAQVVTRIKNDAFEAFEPVLQKINEMINSDRFQAFLDKATPAIGKFADFTLTSLTVIGDVLGYIMDSLDVLIPVIGVAAAAWGIYQIAVNRAAIEQAALNALMNANPILLVISAITALITAVDALWTECEGFRNGVIDIILDILEFSYNASVKVVDMIWDVWDNIRPIVRAVGVFLGPAGNTMVQTADTLVNNKNNLDQYYQQAVTWLNGQRNPESSKSEDVSAYDYSIPEIANYTGAIADNTSALASASEGTLKYLKDIAEREAINRFTTAEVKVELGGVSNTINNTADMDGFVSLLAAKTEEALSITAAKSYA